MAGCGAQKQKETTEKVSENTQQTTEKVKDTESTETLAEETAKYPEIQTDDKIKDYQSVVTVGDTAFELYPYGETHYALYDDDGKTELYRLGEHATTHITSSLQKGRLNVHIYKTTGHFQGQEKNQATELRINLSQMPKKLAAKIGGKSVKLPQVNSLDELRKTGNAWFFDEAPQLNRFATPGSEFEKMDICKNPMVYVRLA